MIDKHRIKHFAMVICVYVCVLMPVLRSYKNQSILSQDVVFQRSTVCTKKKFIVPNHSGAFGKQLSNFPISRKRHQF